MRTILNVVKANAGMPPTVTLTVQYEDPTEALRTLEEAYQSAKRKLLPLTGQHPQVDSRTY